MVIQRSSAPEIARLVDDVLGPNLVRRDAAGARLRVIGSRAVQRLLEALRTADLAGRETILRTLEGIVDARILPVATSLVNDENPAVAVAALAVVQARLPDAASDAATATIDMLTRLILDEKRDESVRAMGLTILEAMSPEGVQLLRERLGPKSPPESRGAAPRSSKPNRLRQGYGPPPFRPFPELRRGLAGASAQADESRRSLRRPLFARRTKAEAPPPQKSKGVQPSGAGVSDSSSPQLATMFAAANGDLPADPDDLRSALHGTGSAVPLSTLHDVIVNIRQKETREERPSDRTAWAMVRAMAHQTLAERQSRIALYDLRETVAAWHDAVPLGFLQAMNDMGDASCLTALASAYETSREPWVKQHIAGACRTIVKREKLSRRHAEAKRLVAHSPELAAEIWRNLTTT